MSSVEIIFTSPAIRVAQPFKLEELFILVIKLRLNIDKPGIHGLIETHKPNPGVLYLARLQLLHNSLAGRNNNFIRVRHLDREVHVIAVYPVVLGRHQTAVLPQDRIHHNRERLNINARVLHTNQIVIYNLVRLAGINVRRHQSQMVEAPVRKAQQERDRLFALARVLVVHEAEVVDLARRPIVVVVELEPHGHRLERAHLDFDLLAVVVQDVGVRVADRVQAHVIEALLGAPLPVVSARKLRERPELMVALDEVLANGWQL